MKEILIYTDKSTTLENAIRQMTDDWIENGDSCDQTLMDCRDALKELLAEIARKSRIIDEFNERWIEDNI